MFLRRRRRCVVTSHSLLIIERLTIRLNFRLMAGLIGREQLLSQAVLIVYIALADTLGEKKDRIEISDCCLYGLRKTSLGIKHLVEDLRRIKRIQLLQPILNDASIDPHPSKLGYMNAQWLRNM